jgi:methyltransferase (TIGR00027 family)
MILAKRLREKEYDQSIKTLFIMEGLIYYLTPSKVDNLFAFVVNNSPKESSVVFDYFPKSLVNGSYESEVGKKIHDRLMRYKEPLKFGIDVNELSDFLNKRGLTGIQNLIARDYQERYFSSTIKDRDVCNLYSFAYAVVK